MANYKTHLSVGVLLGVIAFAVSFFVLLKSEFLSNFFIIIFIVIGSILPDLDSDESAPFKIVFWFFSVVIGWLAFLFFFKEDYFVFWISLGIGIAVVFFIRFAAGTIFEKFTRHRGIFHSIPMAIIFGLICFLFLDRLELTLKKEIFFSLSLILGYIFHLVLDEIFSGINFQGILYKPKKSLGSALKLFSGSLSVNLATYFVLVFLLILVNLRIDFEALLTILS